MQPGVSRKEEELNTVRTELSSMMKKQEDARNRKLPGRVQSVVVNWLIIIILFSLRT